MFWLKIESVGIILNDNKLGIFRRNVNISANLGLNDQKLTLIIL